MTAPKIPVTEYPIAARLTVYKIGAPPARWFYWLDNRSAQPVQR